MDVVVVIFGRYFCGFWGFLWCGFLCFLLVGVGWCVSVGVVLRVECWRRLWFVGGCVSLLVLWFCLGLW